MDIVWRDHVAREHLPSILTHTSAIYKSSEDHVIGQGWLYVGKDALVWICDRPIWGYTNADRIVYGTYSDAGWGVRLRKHRVSRTATTWFGKGASLTGGMRQIESLYQVSLPPNSYGVLPPR